MNKQKRKQLLKKYKEAEKEKFVSSMPLTIEKLYLLFEYVNENIEKLGCDNTLRFTIRYLEENNFNKEQVIEWLNDKGGYYNCEVLINVVSEANGFLEKEYTVYE